MKQLNRKPEITKACPVILLYAAATLVVSTGYPDANAAQPDCHGDTISMLVSPDDKWTALVQEDICSDGAFVTVVVDRVQVVRRGGQPTRDNDVLTLDEHGEPSNRPLLRWLSASRLQITIPNKSLIGLNKGGYEGIEVMIKYEPDDPAERERWLRGLGLAPK